MTNPDLLALSSRLAGTAVASVTPAESGGNSRIYKVVAGDKSYALKQYPSIESDPRDRLSAERHALELMHWHGIHTVPYWIAAEAPYALMSWIDGAVIKTPAESDIDEAAIFLATLHHISRKTHEEDMPPASEACLSGKSIIAQLERRVAALMPHTAEEPQLMKFLSGQFLPIFARRFQAARKAYPAFADELPFSARTLIAADFGFHNIMRKPGGQLAFIDFEYFGWDDPVKLACDFLLHPATALSDTMKHNFHAHMLAIYGEEIGPRFAAYYPLFGLRWALILLNEFIPERWQARVSARGESDWTAAKSAQLAKAEAMIALSEGWR